MEQRLAALGILQPSMVPSPNHSSSAPVPASTPETPWVPGPPLALAFSIAEGSDHDPDPASITDRPQVAGKGQEDQAERARVELHSRHS